MRLAFARVEVTPWLSKYIELLIGFLICRLFVVRCALRKENRFEVICQ